jgi:hypothetical protein
MDDRGHSILEDVPHLMHLATLDERGLAEDRAHRLPQRLRAIGAAWKVHAYRHPANMAPTTACPTNWCALSTQKIQIGAVP